MKRRLTGFTLIELIVVVLIVAILATMGLSQYSKAVETAKADDAFAFTQSIAAANRMFALDHGGRYLSGGLSDAGCATGGAAVDCKTETNACALMWCGYLARQDLTPKPYTFCSGGSTTCGAGCDANTVGCALRKTGAASPYNTWGYTVTNQGVTSVTDPTNMPAVH